MIFVFGSNLQGRHGKGAALTALRLYGAIPGKGLGHYNNSYALPTKRTYRETLTIPEIKQYINMFIAYAENNPDLKFQVTCVGCGLAGYEHKDIAPMFYSAPDNCYFDTKWKEYLEPETKFWGAK